MRRIIAWLLVGILMIGLCSSCSAVPFTQENTFSEATQNSNEIPTIPVEENREQPEELVIHGGALFYSDFMFNLQQNTLIPLDKFEITEETGKTQYSYWGQEAFEIIRFTIEYDDGQIERIEARIEDLGTEELTGVDHIEGILFLFQLVVASNPELSQKEYRELLNELIFFGKELEHNGLCYSQQFLEEEATMALIIYKTEEA